MSLEIQVAVAKANMWALRESGDTFEMVERPHGGLSLVLVDGQSHGAGAKRVSNMVARKAIALLGEGVRDGAAARAAHDYLYTQRQGKVSATLNIISIDLVTRTLVISRNTHCPMLIADGAAVKALDAPSEVIGIRIRTRPVIHELPIAPHVTIVAYTDGLMCAGERRGMKLDPMALVREQCAQDAPAQAIADHLLATAVSLDDGRPADDMSVLVVTTRQLTQGDLTRRMGLSFPIDD
jgi:serine phosphatase RsbU (regulator of sigma subunit)